MNEESLGPVVGSWLRAVDRPPPAPDRTLRRAMAEVGRTPQVRGWAGGWFGRARSTDGEGRSMSMFATLAIGAGFVLVGSLFLTGQSTLPTIAPGVAPESAAPAEGRIRLDDAGRRTGRGQLLHRGERPRLHQRGCQSRHPGTQLRTRVVVARGHVARARPRTAVPHAFRVGSHALVGRRDPHLRRKRGRRVDLRLRSLLPEPPGKRIRRRRAIRAVS